MSQYETVWSEVVELISEVTGLPAGEVSPEQSFEDDFGFDSLTIVEIAVMAEQRIGVPLPDEQLSELRTVGDVAEFIVERSPVRVAA